MITLHAFGRVHPAVHGETRDLRVQWALEEMGLPYRVQGVDHTAGENLGAAFDMEGEHRRPDHHDEIMIAQRVR